MIWSDSKAVSVPSGLPGYNKKNAPDIFIVSKIKQTSNGVSRICPTCSTERAVIVAEDKDLIPNKRLIEYLSSQPTILL